MKVYCSGKNKQIDSYAINTLNIPGVALMHNAACEIAKAVKENVQPLLKICIVCGNGNNAGDGFAVAPMLMEYGYDVSVVCCNDKDLTKDAEYYFERLDGLPIYRYSDDKAQVLNIIDEADAVVDAIYGNGFRGCLDEDCSEIVRAINNSVSFVIAVDIPSGCICNNGGVEGEAVKADITVALSTLKPCYYLYPSCEYCGRLLLADIGILQEAYFSVMHDAEVVSDEYAASLLKDRPVNSHKGTFGKLLMICGSENMPGAAKLAVAGALRSGVGMVKLASVEKVCSLVSIAYSEPVYESFEDYGELNEEIPYIANGCTAIVYGCGVGMGEDRSNLLKSILNETDIPVLIDADGINAACGNINILNSRNGSLILTPHPKELSRLLNISVEEILSNRLDIAKKAAMELNAIVVLKGAHTVIATPNNEAYINLTGNSGLAKGGSGDVLSGIIGSFLAQGYSCRDACILGVYLHGKAADICAEQVGEECMLPSDLPSHFQNVFWGLK